MTVRKKFALNYIVIAILLIALGILAFILRINQQKLLASEQKRYDSLRVALELEKSSDDLTAFARSYVVTSNRDYEKKYWHVLDVRNGKAPRLDGRTVSLRAIMEKLGFTTNEFAKLDESEDNSNDLVWTENVAFHAMKGIYANEKKVFNIYGNPNQKQSIDLLFNEAYQAEKLKIMNPIKDFIKMIEARTEKTVSFYQDRSNFLMFIIIILILSIILAIILTFIFGVNPIIVSLGGEPIEMVEISEQIAGGNLLVDFEKTKKGKNIYASMQYMTKKMREIIEGAHNMTANVFTSAQEMNSASQTLAQGVSEQAAFSEQLAASMKEILSNAKSNAQSANETKNVAENVSKNLGARSTEAINNAKEIMNITTKIEIIDQIAVESNILALNAAVEAARAGNAGKGFAVVADEVQNLANNSRVIAEDIISLANKSADMSKATGKNIYEIRPQMENTINNINEIVSKSDEQATRTSELTRAIEDLNSVIQQSASSSEELAATSEELAASARELNNLISYFKI